MVVALGALVIFWIPIMTTLGLIEPPKPRPQTTEQQPQQQEQQPVTQTQTTPSTTTEDRQKIDSEETTTSLGEPNYDVPVDSIYIETNVWSIVMTNYGGGPVSLELKKYLDQQDRPIQMLPECENATPELSIQDGALTDSRLPFVSSRPAWRYRVDNQSAGKTGCIYHNGSAMIIDPNC